MARENHVSFGYAPKIKFVNAGLWRNYQLKLKLSIFRKNVQLQCKRFMTFVNQPDSTPSTQTWLGNQIPNQSDKFFMRNDPDLRNPLTPLYPPGVNTLTLVLNSTTDRTRYVLVQGTPKVESPTC